MQLTDELRKLETSSDFKRTKFSIKNDGLVMGILRDKLYSNKIKVVVQEYMSNARDAHREAGSPDRPIKVTLPTTLNPIFTVQDFGPGISPERIYNVFVFYGESTKRADNEQTGGFGIGAKCGWSYTDQFSVITCVDGVMYNYLAVLDEGGNGTLLELGKGATTEPNGTAISIPVDPGDIDEFVSNFVVSTYFWKIKPVTNTPVKYWDYSERILAKGSNWDLLATLSWEERRNSVFGSVGTSLAVLDGIPFYIDAPSVISKTDSKYGDFLARARVVMFFSTGELDPAANRESLHYTQKTKEAILKRVRNIYRDLLGQLQEQLDKETSWLAAVWKRHELLNLIHSLNISKTGLTWRGKKLPGVSVALGNKVKAFRVELDYGYSGHNGKLPPDALAISKRHSLSLSSVVKVFINDLESKQKGVVKQRVQPDRKRLLRFFTDDNGTVKRFDHTHPMPEIVVISYETDQDLEDWMEKVGVEDMPVELLSNLPQAQVNYLTKSTKAAITVTSPRVGQIVTPSSPKDKKQVVLRKLTGGDRFYHETVAIDTSGIWCVVQGHNVQLHTSEKGNSYQPQYDGSIHYSLKKMLDGRIYGVTPGHVSMMKEMPNMVYIGDFINELAKEVGTSPELASLLELEAFSSHWFFEALNMLEAKPDWMEEYPKLLHVWNTIRSSKKIHADILKKFSWGSSVSNIQNFIAGDLPIELRDTLNNAHERAEARVQEAIDEFPILQYIEEPYPFEIRSDPQRKTQYVKLFLEQLNILGTALVANAQKLEETIDLGKEQPQCNQSMQSA